MAVARPAVLVVDDEPDNAELLVRALRNVASVEVSYDGPSAVDRLAAGRFVAVIADQVLPRGMTGVELLQQVARVSPETERILVSGHADTRVLSDAINRGHVGHFLAKPVEVRQLVELVRRLVADASRAPDRRALVIAAADVLDSASEALGHIGIPSDRARDLGEARLVPESACLWDLVVWDTATVEDTISALAELRGLAPEAALVCIARAGGDADAPRLLGAGVDDVIWRPLRAEELAVRVRRVLERRRLANEAERLRRSGPMGGLRELIGWSPAMRAIYDTIAQVAPSDASILVRGETGTGKELVARVVHALSSRRDQPFVTVNCAALPEALVESELFGHERGSFTGATARRIGRFERANNGTLFIDEVGDVPPPVQVKLLRALQERSFERVGASDSVHVDIRLVAATNRDLEKMIEQGLFREDLFYRLNVVPVHLAPLRERVEDIGPLTEHYLQVYQRRMGKEGVRISEGMRQALESYAWPGNVRELMNVLERAVALTPSGGLADVTDLKMRTPREKFPLPLPADTPRKLKDLLLDYERRIVRQVVERHGGNRSAAARDLGISRQALSLKLAKWQRS